MKLSGNKHSRKLPAVSVRWFDYRPILNSQNIFFQKRWNKRLGYIWLLALFFMGLLMKGGLFGLVSVEGTKWSGLPLTLLLSFFGILASYPLGVVLAFGRQSRMPVIKSFSIVYIELIRGVPLITMLFMSSVMFPLFLPEGGTILNVPEWTGFSTEAYIFIASIYFAFCFSMSQYSDILKRNSSIRRMTSS